MSDEDYFDEELEVDEFTDIDPANSLLDESDIPISDLVEPTDDEPEFDELTPGDLRGDNS